MKPLEGVLLALDTLSERDKQKVKHALKIKEGTPCQRTGHKYKLVSQVTRLFLPPKQRFICTQCGEIKNV